MHMSLRNRKRNRNRNRDSNQSLERKRTRKHRGKTVRKGIEQSDITSLTQIRSMKDVKDYLKYKGFSMTDIGIVIGVLGGVGYGYFNRDVLMGKLRGDGDVVNIHITNRQYIKKKKEEEKKEEEKKKKKEQKKRIDKKIIQIKLNSVKNKQFKRLKEYLEDPNDKARPYIKIDWSFEKNNKMLKVKKTNNWTFQTDNTGEDLTYLLYFNDYRNACFSFYFTADSKLFVKYKSTKQNIKK